MDNVLTDASDRRIIRIRLTDSGRVQGVGFRYFVRSRAHEHRLSGWVRNLPSGQVELCAQGPPAVVRELVDAVTRGTTSARVTQVDEREDPDDAALPTPFAVIRT